MYDKYAIRIKDSSTGSTEYFAHMDDDRPILTADIDKAMTFWSRRAALDALSALRKNIYLDYSWYTLDIEPIRPNFRGPI